MLREGTIFYIRYCMRRGAASIEIVLNQKAFEIFLKELNNSGFIYTSALIQP